MNPENTPPQVGRLRRRQPLAAANLSLLLAGLGQVYCGDIRRGLAHMWVVGTLLLVTTIILVTPIASRGTVLSIILLAWLAATACSAYQAYGMARRTREDYRLKDYNRPLVYAAFVFLFLIPVIGSGSLLRANFAEVYLVPNASMSPTIPAGSRIVARKDSYRDHDPEVNDLVVFKNPENRRQTFVKRVVATAGAVVEMRDGVVWVDGKPLVEADTIAPDQANFPKTTVPAHHCFVLGDHRSNSRDSRHFGPVAHIALVGKVVLPR